WEDVAFRGSDPRVVEGLAQFYTEVISERLAPRTPGLKTAYERLLSLQSGPYRAHREWLDDDKRQRGEIVRFTLIAARAQGRIDDEAWKRLMVATSRNLSRNQTRYPLFDA